MACYKPLKGWRSRQGGLTFTRRDSTGEMVEVACGNCIGCRIARSREWAVRCMHEAQGHEQNSFITLTYNDEHLPFNESLVKEDFQKFAKRLRGRVWPHKLRYYMCGEYGTGPDGGLGRPHYHAIIFGYDFTKDRYLWEKKGNNRYYRSPLLEDVWYQGYSNITDVTFKTAAYVARYVMKKIGGELAETHYRKTDPITGEQFQVEPEYNAMSRRPGIASEWFKEFKGDVFPHDHVVIEGRPVRTPHFYLKELEKLDPDMFKEVKQARQEYARENRENNTPERLATRELCAESKIRNAKRPLQ